LIRGDRFTISDMHGDREVEVVHRLLDAIAYMLLETS